MAFGRGTIIMSMAEELLGTSLEVNLGSGACLLG